MWVNQLIISFVCLVGSVTPFLLFEFYDGDSLKTTVPRFLVKIVDIIFLPHLLNLQKDCNDNLYTRWKWQTSLQSKGLQGTRL